MHEHTFLLYIFFISKSVLLNGNYNVCPTKVTFKGFYRSLVYKMYIYNSRIAVNTRYIGGGGGGGGT